MSAPRLLVTADDLGLCDAVDDGIFEAHDRGVVRSVSLLVNAPATERALTRLQDRPGLEVGIHLSLVEGFSLLGPGTTLTARRPYLGDERPCLHADWRTFLGRLLTGRLDLRELEAELDLQLRAFVARVGRAPAFVNATQHLHLLPGVAAIVLRLARRFGVRAVRLPSLRVPRPGRPVTRAAMELGVLALAQGLRRQGALRGLVAPDHLFGFRQTGRLTARGLASLIDALPAGTSELVAHPGHDAPALRAALPRSYGAFDWAGELRALCAPEVHAALARRDVRVITFGELT